MNFISSSVKWNQTNKQKIVEKKRVNFLVVLFNSILLLELACVEEHYHPYTLYPLLYKNNLKCLEPSYGTLNWVLFSLGSCLYCHWSVTETANIFQIQDVTPFWRSDIQELRVIIVMFIVQSRKGGIIWNIILRTIRKPNLVAASINRHVKVCIRDIESSVKRPWH